MWLYSSKNKASIVAIIHLLQITMQYVYTVNIVV